MKVGFIIAIALLACVSLSQQQKQEYGVWGPWEEDEECARPDSGECSGERTCCNEKKGTKNMWKTCQGPGECNPKKTHKKTKPCMIRCDKQYTGKYGDWELSDECVRPKTGECAAENTCCNEKKGEKIMQRPCLGPGECDPNKLHKQIKPCMVRCGEWTEWNPKGKCSVTCGEGTQAFKRRCTGKLQEYCEGDAEKTEVCNPGACASWTAWVGKGCNEPCGDGKIEIFERECVGLGKCAEGEATEERACQGNPQCAEWAEWVAGECSVTCGDGTLKHTRKCEGFGECDEGEAEKSENCNLGTCASWTAWVGKGCNEPCGDGKIEIFERECVGLGDCEGEATEERACQGNPQCAEWTEWVAGECSVTCGGGTSKHTRKCEGFGKCDEGEAEKTEKCNNDKCPSCKGKYGRWEQQGGCERPETGECSGENTCCSEKKGIKKMIRPCEGPGCCNPDKEHERDVPCILRCEKCTGKLSGWKQGNECERPDTGECAAEGTCCNEKKGVKKWTRECKGPGCCDPKKKTEKLYKCTFKCDKCNGEMGEWERDGDECLRPETGECAAEGTCCNKKEGIKKYTRECKGPGCCDPTKPTEKLYKCKLRCDKCKGKLSDWVVGECKRPETGRCSAEQTCCKEKVAIKTFTRECDGPGCCDPEEELEKTRPCFPECTPCLGKLGEWERWGSVCKRPETGECAAENTCCNKKKGIKTYKRECIGPGCCEITRNDEKDLPCKIRCNKCKGKFGEWQKPTECVRPETGDCSAANTCCDGKQGTKIFTRECEGPGCCDGDTEKPSPCRYACDPPCEGKLSDWTAGECKRPDSGACSGEGTCCDENKGVVKSTRTCEGPGCCDPAEDLEKTDACQIECSCNGKLSDWTAGECKRPDSGACSGEGTCCDENKGVVKSTRTCEGPGCCDPAEDLEKTDSCQIECPCEGVLSEWTTGECKRPATGACSGENTCCDEKKGTAKSTRTCQGPGCCDPNEDLEVTQACPLTCETPTTCAEKIAARGETPARRRRRKRASNKQYSVIVIDETGSMGNEIKAIKPWLQACMKGGSDSPCPVTPSGGFVLSAFNDPDVKPPYASTNTFMMIFNINKLYPNAGGDCPEPAHAGTLSALTKVPKDNGGCKVFFFSDATPKDRNKFETVKAALLERGCKFLPILTGCCGGCSNACKSEYSSCFWDSTEDPNHVDPNAPENDYYKLAEATGGTIYINDKPETETDLVDFLNDRLKTLGFCPTDNIPSKENGDCFNKKECEKAGHCWDAATQICYGDE